jgi:hypothetical protein
MYSKNNLMPKGKTGKEQPVEIYSSKLMSDL